MDELQALIAASQMVHTNGLQHQHYLYLPTVLNPRALSCNGRILELLVKRRRGCWPVPSYTLMPQPHHRQGDKISGLHPSPA